MEQIPAIIVDDHKIFRESLTYVLESQANINVIAQANNGLELLSILKHTKPGIVLLDIEMPVMDGVEATREAIKLYPDLKILVLSMHNDEEFYSSMIDLGVKGFILKESDTQEVIKAVDEIVKGSLYFSQELLLGLLKKRKDNLCVELTTREQEVLALIAKGLSNIEIGEKLFISVRTVEKHRAELLLKTESKNSISLVVYAIKNGLVTI
ncbi:MAG TPA: response regulator transcription factor [Tenuifilaceae bacterium]|nr:response regulator transcription factor [Tenuifilaceae bacterium]HPI45990.1 response regulator transcription factor [Tenuifilaceae bacterium]HPN22348.1 response regulator transcription factor [Tenuifilaceae bacterium]